MIKTMILAVLTLFAGLGIYLYFYLGVSQPVAIRLETRGPFDILFKPHTGPYHQIAPVIQEVEIWATAHNLRCPQTFGEYLDNPQTMDEDRLRSHGGCVLAAPLATPPPEFNYQHRSERTYAVGHFEGSPAIGPYKVYPKMQRFLEDNHLKSSAPVIELYTVNGENVMTEYLFAIDNPVVAPAAKSF